MARQRKGEKHMTKSRQWFAGVDWASSKHDVTLTDDSGKIIGRRIFEHSGTGLAQMADWLLREILKGAGELVVLEPDSAREAIAHELQVDAGATAVKAA